MNVALDKMRKQVDLYVYQSHVEYLRQVYEGMKSTRKHYTLKDYSKDLGFGENNTMAQINTGHRKLSQKAAGRIAEILKFDNSEKRYFLTLIALEYAKTQAEKEQHMALILELQGRHRDDPKDQQELSFFNDWHHAVVFELLDMKSPSSIEEICKKFAMKLSVNQVSKSIELLEGLGLVAELEKDSGKYLKLKQDFSAGSNVPGMAIVRFHQEMMNLAKESLIETPPNQRDISSVTISIDEDMIERIKSDIRMFRSYLLFIASQSQKGDKVMQINIQFFPLSK